MNEHILLPKDFPTIPVAVTLLITIAVWTLGLSFLVQRVDAGSLTSISDTLSDSDLGVFATHTLAYTNATATLAGQTIKVNFDPTTSLFDGIQSLVIGNISFTGATVTSTCGSATNEVTVSTSTGAGNDAVTFTVCAGDTVTSGSKTIVFGGNKVTNPTSTGSYIIRIEGTQTNTGDTRVAIIDDVVMTASVDTSLTFTIAGLATSSNVNGATTTNGSTATALPFGTLQPGVPKILGQLLNVTTNAANGFTVTVQQDQNLLSNTGADIDLFRNGDATSTPIEWQAPGGILDSEFTYGHYGLTSDDDLNTSEFGTSTAKYAGNIGAAPRAVFSHTGPSDGLTANKGSSTVAIKMEVTSLQEAGNDYTNSLTYVATPVF